MAMGNADTTTRDTPEASRDLRQEWCHTPVAKCPSNVCRTKRSRGQGGSRWGGKAFLQASEAMGGRGHLSLSPCEQLKMDAAPGRY